MGPAAPGRISWAIGREWAAAHDRGAEDAALLDACLVAMDGVFLEWWRGQLPAVKEG